MQAAQAETLADEPDIDRAQIDDLANVLPAEAMRALMESFHASFKAAHEKLLEATACRDLAAAACEAHDLKSITGNFGLRRLQHLAARIEHASRTDNAAEVILLVPDIAVAWDVARKLLDDYNGEAAA